MPIYEYQCNSCDHKLEVIQKISDAPLVQCPECNADSLRKLVSAASFRLKGTGWYETDFKNKPKQGEKASTSTKDESKSADSAGTGSKESSAAPASDNKAASSSP